MRRGDGTTGEGGWQGEPDDRDPLSHFFGIVALNYLFALIYEEPIPSIVRKI